MTEESRDEKLLRILSAGISGKEDWELAKYLIDKRWASGDPLISRAASTFGQILDISLQGPTADGLDEIENLKARISIAKKIENENTDSPVKKISLEDHWYKKPIGIIGLAIISGALLIFVEYLLRVHLSIY